LVAIARHVPESTADILSFYRQAIKNFCSRTPITSKPENEISVSQAWDARRVARESFELDE